MRKTKHLYIAILLVIIANTAFSQLYNDGPIRLRVWAHKVWSSSNCGELGNNEYAIENIRARVLSGGGASYISSPNGFGCTFWGSNNRYYSFNPNQMHAVRSVGLPLEANGYKLLDVNYPSNVTVPSLFEVYTTDAYEEDCTGDFLSCGQGTELNYDECCCVNIPFVGRVCASGDDYLSTTNSWQNVFFRGGNNGVVNYTQPIVMTSSGEHKYTVVFAYQWDWTYSFPPLCASPTYQDAPITVTADFVGLFADSDWDGGTCGVSISGDEDLRAKFRTKDNLTAFGAWPATAIKFSQDFPKWNNANTNIFTRNYSSANTNMQSIDIEYDLWEDDGFETTVFGNLYRPCGDANWDNNFNANCCITIAGFTVCWDGDDNHSTGSFSINNWRNSPPNTDNFIEIPVRLSSSQYENYVARIKYRWTISNPTATVTSTLDNTLCIGTPTTITTTSTNATWFQWQVTNVTGPTPGACPSSGWSDIAGANCSTYIPPQTPGTRIYRLMVFNRNGTGSTTSVGSQFSYAYSQCVRVTYFPYAPPISSVACGATVTQGTPIVFSIPVVPSIGAVANPTSYTWSVSPSAGVTISSPNTASTNITFANTGTYTVTMTVGDACAAANATSTCTVNVTTSSCGYVYLSTSGNDANAGTETQPKLTLANALALANTTSSKHIRVSQGTFNINTITDLESNIIIEGGFNAGTSPWTKDENSTTTLSLTGTANINANIEHAMGLRSASKTAWKLQDLTITAGSPNRTNCKWSWKI
ncbi:MAG: PKD domain-containing protein [Saprospirales bacterium]|nr:PKD domain-containing protein [Saprospirales bacterium]